VSDLKAKMHPIRFPLGLRSRPRWGSLQRSQDPLAVYISKGREGKGESKGKGRGGGLEGPPFRVGIAPPRRVDPALLLITGGVVSSDFGLFSWFENWSSQQCLSKVNLVFKKIIMTDDVTL